MLKNIKNWIELWIGFLLVIIISWISYSAYNSLTSVESWDALTKDLWNQMIVNQEDINLRVNNITNNIIWTGSFVRITATAVIWSSATNTWTSTKSCPDWYTIINRWADKSIQYWWAMSHWYAKCLLDWNWVKASLYTQNWYTWHTYSCFWLCFKD